MPANVRRATTADLPWIVDTIDANRGAEWTEEERERRGFVQGEWSVPILEGLATDTGIFVAEIDGVLAGAAVTSTGSWVRRGPALSTVHVARRAFAPGTFFVYGPVVVAEAFRRRGVLRAMIDHVSHELRSTHQHGVAFVEMSNHASLAAHERSGLEPLEDFELDGRAFRVLAFSTQ